MIAFILTLILLAPIWWLCGNGDGAETFLD
jgi:hypothetical protein